MILKIRNLFLMVLFVNFVSSAQRPTRRERIDLYKTSKICSKELNFSRDDASKIIRGNLERDDEETQCFVKCMYIKTKIMNEKGEINEERLKQSLPKTFFPVEKVPEWIEACKDIKADTFCKRAYDTYACFLKLAFPEASKTHKIQNDSIIRGDSINPMAFINLG